jgi:hypothetical protein
LPGNRPPALLASFVWHLPSYRIFHAQTPVA